MSKDNDKPVIYPGSKELMKRQENLSNDTQKVVDEGEASKKKFLKISV